MLSLVALRHRDLPLIRRWLTAEHVRRWYGPLDGALTHIAAHLGDDVVSPFPAKEAERPIGYLQVYHANADPFWTGFDLPPETFGSDMFIGELDAVGRGIGPRLLRLVGQRLFR